MSNRRELKPNSNKAYNNFNEDHNEIINTLKNQTKLKHADRESGSSLKFWVLTIVLVVVPSILVARSPFFKWNFKNQLKANYIE